MTKNSSRTTTERSNKVLRTQVVALERKGRKEKLAIWRDTARYLAAPHSTETEVNVGHLARLGDGPLVVPGKVLGTGPIDKKLVIGAFSFSSAARRKMSMLPFPPHWATRRPPGFSERCSAANSAS